MILYVKHQSRTMIIHGRHDSYGLIRCKHKIVRLLPLVSVNGK